MYMYKHATGAHMHIQYINTENNHVLVGQKTPYLCDTICQLYIAV